MSEAPFELREAAAKLVYDAMRKAAPEATPEWVEGGNSIRQEEARVAALGVIALATLAERQRDQWQPIETAPKDGADILVCLTHNISADEWVTIQWVDWQVPGSAWPVCESRIDIPYKPTMWQPLPTPPSYEDKA